MSTDIKIDRNTKDIVFENGLLQLVSGSEAAAQRIWTRLHTSIGEWFLDLNFGLPYRSDILVKNPDMGVVSALFTDQILAGAGDGSRMEKLDMTLGTTERELSVDGRVILPDGTPLDIVESV